MKTLLQYIQETNPSVSFPCNGRKQCGKCLIRLKNRELSIHEIDQQKLTKKQLDKGYRLACDHIYHDGDILIKEDIQGDILTHTHLETNIYTVWDNGYGIVIDIGTTTIVLKLIELKSGLEVKDEVFFNPQASYGADVISRIDFDNRDFSHRLHKILITEIHKHLLILSKGIEKDIQQIVVTANTTMMHFFLGEDVSSLGVVPFDVKVKERTQHSYVKIFQTNELNCQVITLPHISAYVGSDIVSGMIACNMDQKQEKSLLIDLGTNGEMALGNKDGFVCCSTAAGPAFEGAGMTCGSGSIEGAITKIKIMENDLKIETINNKPAQSICGSGIVSIISELLKNNLLDEMGRFTDESEAFYLNEELFVNRQDIQAFQLAKAAIQTGISILMKNNDHIQQIYLSGGFGTHLDYHDFITLKIIPHEYEDKIHIVQNSALSGAKYALLTQDFKRFDHLIQMSQTHDLASDPKFNDILIDSLYF